MKYTTAFLLSLILFFSACDEDFFDQVVEVDIPEHTPSLAVTSNLANTDSILWVYVSSSIGILENEYPGVVEDATVEIFKGGILLQNLLYLDQGLYTYQLPVPLGNEEVEYELRVSKPGFESVNAFQQMPRQVNILDATFEVDGTINEDGDRVDELVVEFQDERGIDNFYKVYTTLNYIGDDGEFYSQKEYFNSIDPSVVDVQDGLYFSDGFFDGEKYELRLWNYGIYIGDYMNDPKISVRLVSVSKERYYWETSLRNSQNAEDNPFAEPAVIFSNIENGYGIFSLEAVGPAFEIAL